MRFCPLLNFNHLAFQIASNSPHYIQDEDDDQVEFEMYRVQGTLREWVTRDEVRRFIFKKFRDFLLTYVNPKNGHGDIEYVRLINEMVSGKASVHL